MGVPAGDVRGGDSKTIEAEDTPQTQSGAAAQDSQTPAADDFPAFIHRPALPQDVSRSFDSGWPVAEGLRTRASDLASSTRTGLQSAGTSVRSSLASLRASVPRMTASRGASWLPGRLAGASLLAKRWTGERLRALRPSGVSWQPSISTSLAAQFAGGLFALGALAALIIASPEPEPLKPLAVAQVLNSEKRQAWHRAHLVIPVFDIERRVDFSPGLRTLLSSGDVNFSEEGTRGERGTKIDARATEISPLAVAVPGLIVGSEPVQGPSVAFEPGALPATPEQAFRVSASLPDEAENAWSAGRPKASHEAQPASSVAASTQARPQEAKKLATAIRVRKIPQKKVLAMRKPQPSMITTGSTPPAAVKVAEPASPPPLFPFLSLFAAAPASPAAPPVPGMPTTSAKSQASDPTTPSFGIFY